jgi:acyl-CoA thioesterase
MPKESRAPPARGFNPFAEMIGLNFIEYGGGKSRCALAASLHLFNPHGVLHGAVLYAMADTGMGGALYSLLEERESCATVEIRIHYFKSVTSGNLVCDTWVVNKTKRIESWNRRFVTKCNWSRRPAAPITSFSPVGLQMKEPQVGRTPDLRLIALL